MATMSSIMMAFFLSMLLIPAALAGAVAFGIASLFIGQGIHCDQVAPNGTLDPRALNELFTNDAPQASAAMMTLR